jgi:transcription elongation factor GreA
MAKKKATTKTTKASAPVDEKVTFVTKEGLKALEDELAHLKTAGRKEVAERLQEAISYGDLSENSEYEEAKNHQAFVEGRILELEEKVKHAKVITHKTSQIVELGSEVTIERIKPSKSDKTTYVIVGSTEADPLTQKISNESPVGAALLDHKVGDEVEVSVPAGKVVYKIVKVK